MVQNPYLQVTIVFTGHGLSREPHTAYRSLHVEMMFFHLTNRPVATPLWISYLNLLSQWKYLAHTCKFRDKEDLNAI